MARQHPGLSMLAARFLYISAAGVFVAGRR